MQLDADRAVMVKQFERSEGTQVPARLRAFRAALLSPVAFKADGLIQPFVTHPFGTLHKRKNGRSARSAHVGARAGTRMLISCMSLHRTAG